MGNSRRQTSQSSQPIHPPHPLLQEFLLGEVLEGGDKPQEGILTILEQGGADPYGDKLTFAGPNDGLIGRSCFSFTIPKKQATKVT